MKQKQTISSIELLIVATAIGIISVFSAPWLEMRGTFSAWRIVEWHTFWRGESAFMLGDVVATNYRVTVEFATAQMQTLLNTTWLVGAILATWHTLVLIGLLIIGTRMRLRAGASHKRVALELIVLLAINLVVLSALTWLLALPSSLDNKVDFRLSGDLHTDSLIWSSVNVLPIAPLFSIIAVVGQMLAFLRNRKP